LSASYAFTSSNANTASYVSSDIIGPKFIVPVTVKSSGAAVGWTTYNAWTDIPVGSKSVILEARGYGQSIFTMTEVLIRPSVGFAPEYYSLLALFINGGPFTDASAGQGVFPLDASGNFQYTFTVAPGLFGNIRLRIIGYY